MGFMRANHSRPAPKKIELFNSRYAENGIDPLPAYTPPQPVPDNRFRIVVGRNAYITQSASTNNTLLWELERENSLWIHPVPAKRLGIQHGEPVEVKSAAGKGRLKARVTEETRPDTVYMNTGFGVISKGLSRISVKAHALPLCWRTMPIKYREIWPCMRRSLR